MNKPQKFKSTFLKSALILSSVFSVVFLTATACFTKNDDKIFKQQNVNPLRYETEADETIDFRAIFNVTDARAKALNKIFQKWNQKPEVKEKKPGFLPAKLDQAYGNYTKDQTSLASFLEVKENKKLPNLTLNYPALASTLNKFGMLLDLNTQKDLEEKIKSEYDEKFLEETKNLPEISSERIPFLPILKTSKALLVDKPVLSYILESAKKASSKFKILESDKQKVENLDPQKTDLEYIKKVWGEYKNFPVNENGFDGYTFSFEKFNNFEDIADFLNRVKKSFPDAEKGSQAEKVDFLIGFNDAAAVLFFSSFAQANGNYEKSSYFKDSSGQSLNYNNLFEKSTENYQNTKKAFEIIANLVKNKLVGPWSQKLASDYLKNHQLVFAITSTSNYTRNFEKIGQNFLRFKVGNSPIDYSVSSKSKIWKLVSASGENLPANAIAKIHQILDNKPGYIYEGTSNSISENDIHLSQEDDKNLIEEIKSAIKTQGDLNNFSFLSADPAFDKWLESKQKTNPDLSKLYSDHSSKNKVKLIKQNSNVYIFSKSSEKLNEDELMVLPEPGKTQNSNQFNIVTSQGPSLIGFHNNEKEDVATLNFVKWFISEKVEFETENKQKITATPSDFLAFSASNLNPTKANLKSNFDENPLLPKNQIFKVAFDQFKNQLENPGKYKLFSEPAGVDSNTFRNTMLTTLVQVNNQFLQNPKLDLNFDYFLEQLRANLGTALKKINEKKDEKSSNKN